MYYDSADMGEGVSPGPAELRSPRRENGQQNERPGLIRRAIAVVRAYVPRGNTLDAERFAQRHRLLCWVLGLHVPALFAYALWQGFGVGHATTEVAAPVAALTFAQLTRNRRAAALLVTAGLVFCSSVLVHLSGGTIEAHFHFFVLIGLIALYQDWVPFLWNVGFTVLSHGAGSAIGANLMYNHTAAQNRPWSWAVIHGVAVLAACVGVVIFWKNTELEQRRNTTLAAELAAAHAQAAQRRSVSQLFVNLARRNQSLLDRQLALITELEQVERTPETLGGLFRLDHLATRIRRNAESLLVLAGDDSPRSWGHPVPLGEVVRAAAAEVEDYRRVDVQVSEHLELAGRAVADVAHLLAELIENATVFSPPSSIVVVRSYSAPGPRSASVLSVEDRGIGMTDADRQAANDLLADPPELDLRGTRLGFHVVGRLARRYGLGVSLASTPGGGVTALLTLPDDLVGERSVDSDRTPGHANPPPLPVARARLVAPIAATVAPPLGLDAAVHAVTRSLVITAAVEPEATLERLVRRDPGASRHAGRSEPTAAPSDGFARSTPGPHTCRP
ncbi:MAG: sensor histidine kinase [Acidimicrobiales bacterium]